MQFECFRRRGDLGLRVALRVPLDLQRAQRRRKLVLSSWYCHYIPPLSLSLFSVLLFSLSLSLLHFLPIVLCLCRLSFALVLDRSSPWIGIYARNCYHHDSSIFEWVDCFLNHITFATTSNLSYVYADPPTHPPTPHPPNPSHLIAGREENGGVAKKAREGVGQDY